MGGPLANRYARKDANHKPLIDLWHSWGGTSIDMSPLSKGRPDALLGFARHSFLVEFKMPGNGLTKDQVAFFALWQGSPIHIIETQEDLLVLLRSVGLEPRTQESKSVKAKSAKT